MVWLAGIIIASCGTLLSDVHTRCFLPSSVFVVACICVRMRAYACGGLCFAAWRLFLFSIPPRRSQNSFRLVRRSPVDVAAVATLAVTDGPPPVHLFPARRPRPSRQRGPRAPEPDTALTGRGSSWHRALAILRAASKADTTTSVVYYAVAGRVPLTAPLYLFHRPPPEETHPPDQACVFTSPKQ